MPSSQPLFRLIFGLRRRVFSGVAATPVPFGEKGCKRSLARIVFVNQSLTYIMSLRQSLLFYIQSRRDPNILYLHRTTLLLSSLCSNAYLSRRA